MSYKTITLSLTISLTISYIALVMLYGLAIAEGLETKKVSFGRNLAEKAFITNSEFDQSDQYFSSMLEKEVWEAKLTQAELQLDILNNNLRASK